MNEMPVRPTYDVMSIGHVISGARLLTPLRVNIIVTIYPNNQITNNNNDFIAKFNILAYIGMSIYLVGFPRQSSNCDLNGWK